jgi:uncharacterized membrane-anchored protein
MTTARRRPAGLPPGGRHPASKVPEVTALFWITKVMTTAMGESTSDFLVHRIDPVIAVCLGALGLAVALAVQFFRRTYSTWSYWLAVVMVAVFGTMAADVLHIRFGIPYLVTSTFFAITLTLIFIAWYASERNLSIHSIFTRRREAFYWATVMATFALGTAVGDMTAYTLGLGYFKAAVIFAVLIAIPGLAYRWLGLNGIAAFWAAYVLTRPLGASLADWASVPHWRGGLGFGWGPVSLVLTMVIIGMVSYLAVSGKDTGQAGTPQPGTPQPGGSHGYASHAYAGQPYREQPYGEEPNGEQPYWERLYREPPYQEPPYREQPYQEQPYQEPPYQEAPYREPSYQQRSHPGWPTAGRSGPAPEYLAAPPAYEPSAPPPHRPPPPGRPARPARGGRHRAPRG